MLGNPQKETLTDLQFYLTKKTLHATKIKIRFNYWCTK